LHASMYTSTPRLSILFYNPPATTKIYTLSLHDALPISKNQVLDRIRFENPWWIEGEIEVDYNEMPRRLYFELFKPLVKERDVRRDRKSTRLNSSHVKISYAVFCLKKKK